MNAASQWSRIFFVLIRSFLKKKYFFLVFKSENYLVFLVQNSQHNP